LEGVCYHDRDLFVGLTNVRDIAGITTLSHPQRSLKNKKLEKFIGYYVHASVTSVW
jgi:hypothetical protein